MIKRNGWLVTIGIIFIFFGVAVTSCVQPEVKPGPVEEGAKPAPERAAINIDYKNPKQYLAAGTQSRLEDKYYTQLKNQISTENDDLKRVAEIFSWKQTYFKAYLAGGRLVGKTTINQIMEEKALSGCHDHALVLASIFRLYGLPAIMVDSAGIQWAMDYSDGKRSDYAGHVFVEVYLKNKWILVDSTSGEFVEAYDPHNPVIPIINADEGKGYYALLKGLDPEGYGITSIQQLEGCLKAFAKRVKTTEMPYPQYDIKKLPGLSGS